MLTQLILGLSLLQSAPAISPILGHWQGKVEQQTAVELTIREEANGKLFGTAEFPMRIRQEDGSTVVRRIPEVSMLEMRFDGTTLRFSVMRVNSRTNPPDQTRIDFELDPSGPGKGVLRGATVAEPIPVMKTQE